MALINALIPSAAADVVAIFPERDLPDSLGLAAIPDVIDVPGVGQITVGQVPGFIPFQVFRDARPVRVRVGQAARYMVHPLESGAQTTDHRIILPDELIIDFIVTPDRLRVTYELLRQAQLGAQRFAIQTKTSTYTGMYIDDIAQEEDPGLFDTIRLVVTFREVQFFAAQAQDLGFDDVADAEDASTVLRGEQSPGAPSPDQDSRGTTALRLYERGGALLDQLREFF